jgi:16S rRNA (cytosine967-C5)-methyltransferase
MVVRAAAARAVAAVLAGRSLDTAVGRQRERVATDEHPLLQELAFGTVRHWYRLEPVVRARLRKGLKSRENDVRAALVAGAYEIDCMRTASHAAVDQWVEATRALGKAWAGGLVNGVLRGLLRQGDALAPTGDPTGDHGWPDWLARAIAADWPEQWPEIARRGTQRAPMTLRVDRSRTDRAAYAERLRGVGIEAASVPAAGDALTLDAPVDVSRLPGFDRGEVSVQDAGAQLAAPALAPLTGCRVLDACAAPGGKTAHLAELGPDRAALVAVETDRDRAQRLRAELTRTGTEATVHVADVGAPEDWWDGIAFDRILLDVPCSATGVIRRHPDIRLLRQPDDIDRLSERQAALLDAVWPLLAPGGILVYVTCSILRRENAQQIEAFMARMPEAQPLAVADAWGRSDGPGRQLLPGEQGMDGFYYARLQRGSPS